MLLSLANPRLPFFPVTGFPVGLPKPLSLFPANEQLLQTVSPVLEGSASDCYDDNRIHLYALSFSHRSASASYFHHSELFHIRS